MKLMSVFVILFTIFPLTSIAEDEDRSALRNKFGIGADLQIHKLLPDDPIPELNTLRIWYEQYGDYDLAHVDNWSFSQHIEWTARVYELGDNCVCAQNKCIASGCNKPLEDKRAYAGEHRCMPILEMSSTQNVASCR